MNINDLKGKIIITTGLEEREDYFVQGIADRLGMIYKANFVKKVNYMIYNPNYGQETVKLKSARALVEEGKDVQILTYDVFRELLKSSDVDINRIEKTECLIIDGTLIKYQGNAERVIIPDGVTVIGHGAFHTNYGITEIQIPDTVTTIEKNAFMNCINLKSINLPDSIVSIGKYAFSGCHGLTIIRIPRQVRIIEENTFAGCEGIKEVIISENVVQIGAFAFSNCRRLERINIPQNLQSIGMWAFSRCSMLKDITIPHGISKIDEMTFCGCTSLKSVEIPEGVQTIAKEAFRDCLGLRKALFPGDHSALSDVDKDAFLNCSDLSIYAPKNSYIANFAICCGIPFHENE